MCAGPTSPNTTQRRGLWKLKAVILNVYRYGEVLLSTVYSIAYSGDAEELG